MPGSLTAGKPGHGAAHDTHLFARALSYLAVTPPWPHLTRLALTRSLLRTALWRSTFKAPVSDLDDIANEMHRELGAKRDGNPYSDWQRYEIGWRAMKVNHLPQLDRIRCPTLFIHGKEDDFVPVDVARHAAARIPDAALQILDGCGHWSPRERPSEVSDAILSFLHAGHP